MTITEVGRMEVKPGLDVMKETTPEGKILTRVWKHVVNAPGGPHRVYWGLEVEDPSHIWAFFDWDSVSDHEEFAKGFGKEATKELPKIMSRGDFTEHIAVAPSPPSVLLSPVTEVMLAYFPPDISPAAKDAASARFQQFKEKGLDSCSEVAGVSYGWGVENDFPVRDAEDGQKGALLLALIGWPSLDAHLRFRDTKAFRENVGLLEGMEGVVKMAMFHLKCHSLGRNEE